VPVLTFAGFAPQPTINKKLEAKNTENNFCILKKSPSKLNEINTALI
jgi:hypothetical protein